MNGACYHLRPHGIPIIHPQQASPIPLSLTPDLVYSSGPVRNKLSSSGVSNYDGLLERTSPNPTPSLALLCSPLITTPGPFLLCLLLLPLHLILACGLSIPHPFFLDLPPEPTRRLLNVFFISPSFTDTSHTVLPASSDPPIPCLSRTQQQAGLVHPSLGLCHNVTYSLCLRAPDKTDFNSWFFKSLVCCISHNGDSHLMSSPKSTLSHSTSVPACLRVSHACLCGIGPEEILDLPASKATRIDVLPCVHRWSGLSFRRRGDQPGTLTSLPDPGLSRPLPADCCVLALCWMSRSPVCKEFQA